MPPSCESDIRRLYPFTSYHTSFFAHFCHKGIVNGLDIILPRLYPSQQKYIIKRKIWTAPILKVKKKCGMFLLYYLWIKKSMQNASPPQSLGKQKIKRLLLEQSLCNFFISVLYRVCEWIIL